MTIEEGSRVSSSGEGDEERTRPWWRKLLPRRMRNKTLEEIAPNPQPEALKVAGAHGGVLVSRSALNRVEAPDRPNMAVPRSDLTVPNIGDQNARVDVEAAPQR